MISNVKVGLFGIGLDTYWPQFDGLENKLKEYLSVVHTKLERENVTVVNLGLIDKPEKAFEAGHTFRTEDVDIIFLHVTTYALSSTVLPVVMRAKVPVVVLNLSPAPAISYAEFNALKDRTKMTGKWLEFCSACPVPEIANVFNRTGIEFYQISGVLNGDDHVDKEINEWIEAAKVAHVMFHNRLGIMGHLYNGMLDIATDITQQIAHFGGHVEIIEVDELSALRESVTDNEIKNKVKEFYEAFDIQPDCADEDLKKSAETSVALDKLVHEKGLGSLAYFYSGSGVIQNEDTISSIILGASLLTARNIPVAGEYEIKNVQAMKILDSFGVGGSFTEFYAMDYNEDVVLMGHDGPGHITIAEGKIKVRPLDVYHGKVGAGLSVEMSVKHGPVTVLSIAENKKGKLKFLIAEGESVSGPILEIGNTNSRYKFSIGAREFVEQWSKEGPAHHMAIGIGHISSKIIKLANLLNMEVIKIC